MELLKSQSWLNQLEKKLFLFFISFSSTQIVFLDTRFVFVLPVLSLAFVVGKVELIFTLLGITMGSFLVQDSLLLVGSVTFILLLGMMSHIYSFKTRFISSVTTFYLFLIELVFFKSAVNTTIMASTVTLFLTFTCLKHASVFIHQKETYEKREIYFIGLLSFFILLPLYHISPIFLMLWIRLLLLLVLYISQFFIAYELALEISFILLVMDIGLKEEILILLLPLSFFHVIQPKTKLAMVSVYVLSHLTIPFLTDNSIRPFVFEVVVSSFSFMFFPSRLQLLVDKEVNENKWSMDMVSQQRKIKRQLENYSDLFFKIAHSFHDMRLDTSVISYVGTVEESLCEKCINAQECFNKKKGDHRLIKLLKKGIMEGLTKEEQHYVECYCLHMVQYKKLMSEQRKLYLHQKEMNEQYQILKHHLYDQLSLVGDLLKNYGNNIEWNPQHGEEGMKDLLEAYHYKIWFIQKENVSMHSFRIEIGMTEITKKEVYDVVVPVLERYLDTKLGVVKLENNANQLGYTYLVLSNHHHYELLYGFQQISKDRRSCGDSYLSFQHHSNMIIALSDGMGYGRRAHEESDLTLDVFSRLLKSGIQMDDCIQTINALLRIKNRIEMFTTLDVMMFDTNLGEARFFKNGAMPSFIYRSGELIKIEPKALPIGIVHEINTYQEHLICHDGDLLIMMSDGFEDGIEEVLRLELPNLSQQVPQFIADSIMNTMLENHRIDDDATIIVTRVQKIN